MIEGLSEDAQNVKDKIVDMMNQAKEKKRASNYFKLV